MNSKIAIVMPSYLGEYEGAASNRVEKFKRAVETVLRQTYSNAILIIVSDGCEITNNLVKGSKLFRENRNVFFIPLQKQPLFSGSVRAAGVRLAIRERADIVCYLDADDCLLPDHLQFIDASFKPGLDWIYFNDLLYPDAEKGDLIVRESSLKFGSIGTSNIAHKAWQHFNWTGLDGWGHDWAFILRLMAKSQNYMKTTEQGLYVVHHIKGSFDN
jgi:glycosyltransferase involved in cell wall biosynthesis